MKRFLLFFALIMAGMSAMAASFNVSVFGRDVTYANRNDILGDGGSMQMVGPSYGVMQLIMKDVDIPTKPSWATSDDFVKVTTGTTFIADTFGIIVVGQNKICPVSSTGAVQVANAFECTCMPLLFDGNGKLTVHSQNYCILANRDLFLRKGYHDFISDNVSLIYVQKISGTTPKLIIGDDYNANLRWATAGVGYYNEVKIEHAAIRYDGDFDYHLQDICGYEDHPFCYTYMNNSYGYEQKRRIKLLDHSTQLVWRYNTLGNEKHYRVGESFIMGKTGILLNGEEITYENVGDLFGRSSATYKDQLRLEPKDHLLKINGITNGVVVRSLTFERDYASLYLPHDLYVTGDLIFTRDLDISGPGRLIVQGDLIRQGRTDYPTTGTLSIHDTQVTVTGSMFLANGNDVLTNLKLGSTATLTVKSGKTSGIASLTIGNETQTSIVSGHRLNNRGSLAHYSNDGWAQGVPVVIRMPERVPLIVNGQRMNEATQWFLPLNSGMAYYNNDTLYLGAADFAGDVESKSANLVIQRIGRIPNNYSTIHGALKGVNIYMEDVFLDVDNIEVANDAILSVSKKSFLAVVGKKTWGITSPTGFFTWNVRDSYVSIDPCTKGAVGSLLGMSLIQCAITSPSGARYEGGTVRQTDGTIAKSLTINYSTALFDRIEMEGWDPMKQQWCRSRVNLRGNWEHPVDVDYYGVTNDSLHLRIYAKTTGAKDPYISFEVYSESAADWFDLKTEKFTAGQFLNGDYVANVSTKWGHDSIGPSRKNESLNGESVRYRVLMLDRNNRSDTLAVDYITCQWMPPARIEGPVRYRLHKGDWIELAEGEWTVEYGMPGDENPIQFIMLDKCHPTYLFWEKKETLSGPVDGVLTGGWSDDFKVNVFTPRKQRWFYFIYDRGHDIENTYTTGYEENAVFLDCDRTVGSYNLPSLNNPPVHEGDSLLGWTINFESSQDSVFYSTEAIQEMMMPSFEEIYDDPISLGIYKSSLIVRFNAVWYSKAKDSGESIEEILLRNEERQKNHKVLINGHVFILVDNQWYDVTGQKL